MNFVLDPLAFAKEFWPDVYFYGRQREIIYSVRDNVETYVVAGNKLGKDFTAAFVVLWYFLNAIKAGRSCRIITTSVKEEHLDVLWGEIGRFLTTSRHPLMATRGGPLAVNYHEIRRKEEMDSKNPLNYLKGMVAKDREGMQGHHAEMTLFVGDEASALDDAYYEAAQGWAKRFLLFSNPEQCENFFKRAVKAGDLAP